MPGAVGIVGNTVPKIEVADDRPSRRVDHGDGVLTAIGDEDALAVGGTNDVPRLGASGEVSGQDGGLERTAGRIVDPDDGDRAGGGVGDISVLAIGCQRNALWF